MSMTYDIGPRVQAALEHSGYRKADIARRAGINWGQLWKILNGKQPTGCSGETVRRLALALEVSADYLLGLSDSPQGPHTEEHPHG